MGILDIFSKRNVPPPDVYVYDTLPDKLRVQICHILKNSLGEEWTFRAPYDGWQTIAEQLAPEHCLIALPARQSRYGHIDHFVVCMDYLLQAEAPQALDLVELAVKYLDQRIRGNPYHQSRYHTVDEAIAELNHRFREHGVGLAYESGQLVRIDSQLLHTEVVKPAFALLHASGFEGPNAEFLSAHEHLRHSRIEEAILDACKAFESTLKAICDARKWRYSQKDAASALIKLVIDKGLIPTYSDEQLGQLSKLMTGIATIRNKNAGHGAGAKPREVPDHYAAYALHLAASNIVFLIQSHLATR